MKIGVLALQGAFIEHVKMLQHLGVEAVEVRLPEQLADLDGLILPGGESTTMGKLMIDYGLLKPIQDFGEHKPIWGTCAGAILLSKDANREQPLLGLMDITVERNAFGRQIDSFQTDLNVPALATISDDDTPYQAVFIRAPIIASVDGEAKVLAQLDDGRIIAVQDRHFLATSFHPELTQDPRFHQYFLSMADKK